MGKTVAAPPGSSPKGALFSLRKGASVSLSIYRQHPGVTLMCYNEPQWSATMRQSIEALKDFEGGQRQNQKKKKRETADQ